MVSPRRSHRSLTASLAAYAVGPAKTTPAIAMRRRLASDRPDDPMPQAKAHMGANHVVGLRNSRTVGSDGRAMEGTVNFTNSAVNLGLHFYLAFGTGQPVDDDPWQSPQARVFKSEQPPEQS